MSHTVQVAQFIHFHNDQQSASDLLTLLQTYLEVKNYYDCALSADKCACRKVEVNTDVSASPIPWSQYDKHGIRSAKRKVPL